MRYIKVARARGMRIVDIIKCVTQQTLWRMTNAPLISTATGGDIYKIFIIVKRSDILASSEAARASYINVGYQATLL